ncbi:MAG: c-type cytochrome [Variovorax sp.]|nr:c-type cytochrome [Variovorax sp.]
MNARILLAKTVLGVAVTGILIAGAVVALNLRGEDPVDDSAFTLEGTSAQVERGRYLALAGNCAGCHTARGGAPYAGGNGIETPFGTIYASNLTPDAKTGIGRWNADHFWRAMHHGRSRDGRLLYPAFPYTSFTHITREDSDAMYVWLRTLPPTTQPNREHDLDFPYNTQAALAVWRALYFSPGREEAKAPEDGAYPSAEWHRGAYLVRGLGHCAACHGSRNAMGATDAAHALAGGMLPGGKWYAPALDAASEAGVAGWSTDEVVALLKSGRTEHASVSGPMAEVVYRSTQHLRDEDLRAMATYLQALPARPEPSQEPAARRSDSLMKRGERIYAQQCAWCHGERGEGVPGAFPRLAGNRAVSLANPANLVQIVRRGGYPPVTEGNPRPYGMPPFGQFLDDAEIAAVLTYVRGSWGNDAAEVTQRDAVRR